jgi:hypothetical protein
VIFRTIRTVGLGLLLSATSLPLMAAPRSGKISGVVVDLSGTPQMGATVSITSEQINGSHIADLLTNDRGHFFSGSLLPGLYSVRVSLAGFLPAMEQHVQVSDQRTTLLEIQLGSVFSSLARLRQPDKQAVDAEEWTWVLRSSTATRPVLRWNDGEVLLAGEASQAEAARKNQPRGQIEFTSGSRHPGSISNIADTPATAFAYDQTIGAGSRLLFAGQFSYERASASGGFATVWLPAGDKNDGPVTSFVLRQSQLGPVGPAFRGLRVEHNSQFALGDRLSVHYGAEYLLAGFGRPTSALRPRIELGIQLEPTWRAAFMVAASPWSGAAAGDSALQSALESLDAFPTLLMRDNHPVLEGGWHEELAVEHSLGGKASLVAAGFRDRSSHTAVFGHGAAANPDYLQDFFSNAFVYDGSESGSWGARLAYRQKVSDNLETEVVYAWAGALAPDAAATNGDLRSALDTRYRHSLGARVSSHLPLLGTQLTAGYKWISGPVVSRQDSYGEAVYGLDPYLNITVRQPLPKFFPCHMAALADFGNLLSQGYVPVTTRDGRVMLIAVYRSFRGGLSLQF